MKLPRVMIAAPKSGSGKTIITCGLLEALKRGGADVRSYKCGPDYIDPMFHRRVIGVPGGNLDMFFSTPEEIIASVCRGGGEAAVMEGVMGIYDGIAGTAGRGSCYDVAAATDTPVILVMDVKGMGQTMLSIIKGILLDDKANIIKGIILNRISGSYYGTIAPGLREVLNERGVKLLGGVPDTKGIHLESRHLGLKMPGDISDLKEQLSHAADLVEENLDMAALKEIMESAPGMEEARVYDGTAAENSDVPCLAVARDDAFCFYYEENLRMLRDAGIRIKEFSPLRDSRIPEEADGLLLGGGYPELYAAELGGNTGMLGSVREAIGNGMPSLAECGGFMYLLDCLKDKDGSVYPMAGVIEGESFHTGKLSRFGYIDLTGETAGTLLSGRTVKAHEFHYFDSSNNGTDAAAVKPWTGRSWKCMHAGSGHLWGYPHLWYPSCPDMIEDFANAMRGYRRKRKDG